MAMSSTPVYHQPAPGTNHAPRYPSRRNAISALLKAISSNALMLVMVNGGWAVYGATNRLACSHQTLSKCWTILYRPHDRLQETGERAQRLELVGIYPEPRLRRLRIIREPRPRRLHTIRGPPRRSHLRTAT